MTDKVYEANTDREEILFEDVGTTDDGFIKIKFTNTEFNDIIFNIGKVWFDEQDEAILHFEHNIHEGEVPDDKLDEFQQLLGDFILQAIVRGLDKNDLVYSGGVDENRNNDTEQPGT
jgi:hypothetical protein